MSELSQKKSAVTMRRLKATNPDYILRDVYYSMLKRCYSPKQKNFCIYGGRGIRVSDDWRKSFHTFKAWAYANGWKPELEIDRIDVDGHYEPSNCRFVTHRDNSRNRRDNKLTVETVAEIRRLLAEGFTGPRLAKMFSVHHSLIYRIKLNQVWL